MNIKEAKSVHLIGAGGINMSAVGKILLAAGVRVSGSDLAANEQTERLKALGATIAIGEDAANVPADAELVVYTSAAPETNKERQAAAGRGLRQITNFKFLAEWFHDAKTYAVAGTHGKSTTTAMLGLILEKAGLDSTVVVGSKVPAFAEGNLRQGKSDLFVVEGDEYARHFLEFHPDGVILNNLELDHTDIFSSIGELLDSFHDLTSQVKDGGIVVVNTSDERLARLIETEREDLTRRGVRIVAFGGAEVGAWSVASRQTDGTREASLSQAGTTYRFNLQVPGDFNAMNAAGAFLLAKELGASYEDVAAALADFKGIWRRFELLGEKNGALIYSDYGHHPTAVAATLKAARESFPGRRIMLCFQPHHRNRTKSLFRDFIPSFDGADVLILCEIYDVAGREAVADQKVSSRDLVEAVTRHDAERSAASGQATARPVEYAPDPAAAVARALELAQAGDVVIVMGAGDIDGAIRKIFV